MRNSILAILFLAITTGSAAAQGSTGTRLFGELPPLTTGAEEQPSNELRGTLQFATAVDNNLVTTKGHRLTDVLYELQPAFSFIRTSGRLTFILDAAPQLILHQKFNQRDLFSDATGLDLQYQLASHTTVRLRNNYKREDDPLYDGSRFNPLTPQFTVMTQAPTYVIVPSFRLTSEQGEASITQSISDHSHLTVTGSFYDLNWNNLINSSSRSLISTRATSGLAMYELRISRRNAIGVTYKYQDLSFSRQHSTREQTQSFYLVDTLTLSPRTTIQAFAGPESSHVRDELVLGGGSVELLIPLNSHTISGGGGLTYHWQANSTGLQATLTHQVGGSGGYLTAARSTTGSFTLTRRLSRQWSGHVGMQYADNSLLGASTKNGATYLRLISGNASASYKLTEHTALHLQYSRGHLLNHGLLQVPSINADRLSLSVEYQFRHPLGR